MPRRREVKFAVSEDGKQIFVRLQDSGIAALVAMIDGLPLMFFGKSKTPYLTVETALAWHEKELRFGRAKSQIAVEAFQRVLEKFRLGEVVLD